MYLINHRIDRLFWFSCFMLMSAYILYEHSTSCLAVDLDTMMERHRNLIAGHSEFFNPWQYRILAPFMLEGIIQTFNTVLPGTPDILPYLFLRFVQILLLLYIAFYYYKSLNVSNPAVLFAGMMLLCYCISNSVFQSDLSFNTYFDVIFYLLAACVILNHQIYWIIPITFFAALNRETSGFIPFMLIAAFVGKGGGESMKNKWIIAGVSLVLFFIVFISIRLVYGYQEAEGIHGMTSPMAYLSFNLSFFRMYPQLFGTLGLIPVITLIGFAKLPKVLKNWFWLIVPFWFIIDLAKSTAVETRLFLVPQALIFIPALLCLAEYYFKSRHQSVRNE
jgi:hypothetical protein